MTLHKMVNGARVDLSAEEAAAITAEWTANAAAPPTRSIDRLQLVIDELAAKTDASSAIKAIASK